MNPKISIVIPVYNEGDTIRACLDAISRLSTKPFEVIIVDNNSTDHSLDNLNEYDLVKIIQETKQGVVHARNTGFDYASGDIIARIDADTILPNDWLDKINDYFLEHPQIVAVSGACDYYDFLFANLVNTIDLVFRKYIHRRLRDRTFLFGANMAIQKSAWTEVSSRVCKKKSIHEDMDLAIHLQEMGFNVSFSPQLVAGTSFRRIDSDYPSFIKYSLVSPHTYAVHNIKRRIHMYPIILFCWLVYFPAHLIYLFYSPEGHDYRLVNFSIRALHQTRVDPTSNVI